MEQKAAVELLSLVLESSESLNRSMLKVRDHCSEEEFLHYREVAGKLMGDMIMDIINPLEEGKQPLEKRAS